MRERGAMTNRHVNTNRYISTLFLIILLPLFTSISQNIQRIFPVTLSKLFQSSTVAKPLIRSDLVIDLMYSLFVLFSEKHLSLLINIHFYLQEVCNGQFHLYKTFSLAPFSCPRTLLLSNADY